MLNYCQISNEADPWSPAHSVSPDQTFTYKQISTQSPSLAENVAVKSSDISKDICEIEPDFATNPPSLSDYWVMLRLGAGRMADGGIITKIILTTSIATSDITEQSSVILQPWPDKCAPLLKQD